MHIGVVDEWLPYPINNGKKSRSFNLLVPLATQHRITYLAPRGHDANQDRLAEAELRDRGLSVIWADQHVPLNSGPLFGPRLAANLLSKFPYSVQRHSNSKLRQAAAKLETTSQVDLWHVEWTPYVHNLREHVRSPWVINAHNIESLIWRRYWETEPNLFKAWYIRQQWQKFEAFERAAFRDARCVIATTECDAELARQHYGTRTVEVVSNGVDLSHFEFVDKGRNPLELLFLGSLAWRPNLEAVRQLLDTIFPRIQATELAARLTIVGLDPPAWLSAQVERMAGVTLHGSVPDVRPYLARCGALLVPLSIGGGSRIKILEALASGCPVISTTIGAEGLHLRRGIDYLHVNKMDEFASATIEGILNYPRLAQTAASGNQVVREQYGWDQLSQKLGAIWESQLAKQKVSVA